MQGINAEPLTSAEVKGGEGWVKGWRNSSPLATPVFIGVSSEKVKSEE